MVVLGNAQVGLRKSLELLNNASIDLPIKARLLGLELVNAVGLEVLKTAVKTLGDEIRTPTPGPQPSTSPRSPAGVATPEPRAR
jgi:hypothetical protein